MAQSSIRGREKSKHFHRTSQFVSASAWVAKSKQRFFLLRFPGNIFLSCLNWQVGKWRKMDELPNDLVSVFHEIVWERCGLGLLKDGKLKVFKFDNFQSFKNENHWSCCCKEAHQPFQLCFRSKLPSTLLPKTFHTFYLRQLFAWSHDNSYNFI